MLPTKWKYLISSIPKKTRKSHVKYFFSQVGVASFLWFFSYLYFYSLKALVLDPLCFWVLSERTQKHLLLLCYWLPLLPHLFRPVSFYSKIPAPLPLFCLWSVSDLLWSPRGSHSPYFPCAAYPCASHHCCPGHSVTPSWALQIHNSASWRRCCFLRGCPKKSNHFGKQLEGHPKAKSVCQLLWLCYYSPSISSTLPSVFYTNWLCWLPHTPIPPCFFFFFCSAQKHSCFFSQFLHNPASWLSFKFLLQAILLCYKKTTGLCQVLRKSLIVIYRYSAKKYYFIFPPCSPVCLTAWLYLLCLSVAFRAHM